MMPNVSGNSSNILCSSGAKFAVATHEADADMH